MNSEVECRALSHFSGGFVFFFGGHRLNFFFFFKFKEQIIEAWAPPQSRPVNFPSGLWNFALLPFSVSLRI